ncbi:MAG: DsbA family protein [Polyangiales bacterium]
MQEPRSPYFIPKPPPPPPPGPPPPPRSAGLLALGITLGVLVGVGVTAAVLLPTLLSKDKHEEPRDEEPKKKEKNEKKVDDEPPVDTDVAIKILPTDPVRGGKRAKVTIVEFSDFQCPFCGKASTTMEALLKKYDEDLRLVWKDEPLDFHKEAMPAAKAAKTAFLDSGATAFWKLHDKIYANQSDLGTELSTWAADVGVTAKATTKFESTVEKAIKDSIALAKEVGATGTPCFFIDGQRLSGAQPQASFEKVIDEHIVEADALLAKGVSREDLYPRLYAKHYEDPEPGTLGSLYKVEPAGVAKWGPEDALVTIVVYGNLSSKPTGLSRMSMSDLVALADTRVIFRDIPGTKDSREAASVVRAIGAKDPKERARAIEDAWGSFPADLVTFGTDHGLTAAEAKKAIASAATDKSIDDDVDSASLVDVFGTQMFVNGRKQWSWSTSDVTSTVAAEKKRAKKLIAKGVAPRDVYVELTKSGTSHAPKMVKLAVPSWAPARGPASAKVVVQVFSDFQCPFCRRAETKGGGFFDAVAAHASDVRVVFRHNPLPFHPMAEPAAQLALEAKAQKGEASFFRVHDALFAATTLDMTKLESIAIAEGLDLTKVRAAISTHKHKKIIDDDIADAKSAGISGTPAFIVGEELVSGAQTQTVFEAAITRAKAKAP